MEPGACQQELGTSWDWRAYLRQLLYCGAWILFRLLAGSSAPPSSFHRLSKSNPHCLSSSSWCRGDSHGLRRWPSPAARHSRAVWLRKGTHTALVRPWSQREKRPSALIYFIFPFSHSFLLLSFLAGDQPWIVMATRESDSLRNLPQALSTRHCLSTWPGICQRARHPLIKSSLLKEPVGISAFLL